MSDNVIQFPTAYQTEPGYECDASVFRGEKVILCDKEKLFELIDDNTALSRLKVMSLWDRIFHWPY